jgi:hypothetical protein
MPVDPAMNEETGQQILQVLREIREGQREALQAMGEHRALVKDQIDVSRKTVEESVGLQRLAIRRQRAVTLVAVPAIFACIAAIAWLVLRYF